MKCAWNGNAVPRLTTRKPHRGPPSSRCSLSPLPRLRLLLKPLKPPSRPPPPPETPATPPNRRQTGTPTADAESGVNFNLNSYEWGLTSNVLH